MSNELPLEVLGLQSQRWLLVETYEGDAIVRVELFDAIELGER